MNIAAKPAAERAFRILLVEDDPTLRQFLRIALEKPGRVFDEAETAIDALYTAQLNPPDAVVTDIGLAGDFDAFAMLDALRADPAFKSLQVVVVSGRDDPASYQRANGLGVVSYLVKPVLVDQLSTLVDRMERNLAA